MVRSVPGCSPQGPSTYPPAVSGDAEPQLPRRQHGLLGEDLAQRCAGQVAASAAAALLTTLISHSYCIIGSVGPVVVALWWLVNRK